MLMLMIWLVRAYLSWSRRVRYLSYRQSSSNSGRALSIPFRRHYCSRRVLATASTNMYQSQSRTGNKVASESTVHVEERKRRQHRSRQKGPSATKPARCEPQHVVFFGFLPLVSLVSLVWSYSKPRARHKWMRGGPEGAWGSWDMYVESNEVIITCHR